MAFTSVAARQFASPPCQQLRALSSRFSGSGCPEAEGTRLSGERVITRADSFHSASTSTSLRTHPLFSAWKRGIRDHAFPIYAVCSSGGHVIAAYKIALQQGGEVKARFGS